MRAITVRQPWAALILHGGKNIENRRRNIIGRYRGPVAVHAALTVDKQAAAHHNAFAANHPAAQHLGAVLGVVDIIGIHRAGDCLGRWRGRCQPWGESDVMHIELANPRPIEEPIPCRGFLGLWTPPTDVVERLVTEVTL